MEKWVLILLILPMVMAYPEQFHVEGNVIVNECGQERVFRGLDTIDAVVHATGDTSIWPPDDYPWDKAHYDEMASWGAKIVRVTVEPFIYRQEGAQTTINVIDEASGWAADNGMYTYIDFHSIGRPWAEEYTHSSYETSQEEIKQFWDEMSEAFVGDHRVAFYEIFNEPTGQGQNDWLQWRDLAEEIIDIIKANDPDKPIIVGGLWWAYDLSHVVDSPVRRENIIYATHPYPQSNEFLSWEAGWGHVADTYPVFATEFGFDRGTWSEDLCMSPDCDSVSFRDAVVNLMEARGISWSPWCFSDSWTPTMLTGNYQPNEAGEHWRTKLLELNQPNTCGNDYCEPGENSVNCAADCCGSGSVAQEEYYGTGLKADGLANLEVGKSIGRQVDYRFKATKSGMVDGVRIFFIYPSGYGKGDGGDILVELKTDDGTSDHNPSDTLLGSYLVTDPMSENFPLIPINPPVMLEEGNLYHIEFSNTVPDPVNNYVSIDDLYNKARVPNMQPTVSDTDLAVLWKTSTTGDWSVNYGHTPIYCFEHTDGSGQGVGYMDAFSSSGRRTISGDSKVRTVFTVSGGDRNVIDANVRVEKVDGSGGLVIRLEDSNGNLIEEGTVPASSIDTDMSWASIDLDSVLGNGETYHLVLSSDGDYTTFGIQDGTGYDFHPDCVFDDGEFQYTTGGSWSDDRNADLQFYFTVEGSVQSYCGDGNCDANEDCTSCEADCGECQTDCVHEADQQPCDGCVDTLEMSDYIDMWKRGEVTINNLMTVISLWKQGC